MDKLDYGELIMKMINQYAEDHSDGDLENTEIVFDQERDRYLLLYVGWEDENRMYGCPIHISIKNGKIWIQRDFTEEGIAHKLVELGVPKTDIVLGFREPYIRHFTGFAVV